MSITRCPHCGTANRAGSNFCNGCGTDLRESQTLEDLAAAQESASSSAPPPPEATSPAPASPPSPAASVLPNQPDSSSAVSTPVTQVPEENQDFADQPWLRLEFAGDDEQSLDADLEDEPNFDDSGRLFTAVQGLLAPIRITSNISDESSDAGVRSGAPVGTLSGAPVSTLSGAPVGANNAEALSNDDLRLIRGLMSDQPGLVNYQVRPALSPMRPLRIGWIFVLLGVAIGLPALFLAGPLGTPNRWPGVREAYLTIQNLAPDSRVVLYWGYDPATSGELDLAMVPVVRHLFQQRARLAIVTSTPGGIGSAERLISQVRATVGSDDLTLAADAGQPVTFSYLPGGAASLPLLARDPSWALLENIMVAAPELRQSLVPHTNMVVVAAARSEDAQAWLEQVQALDHIPVVAVTAAGADPILRPYLDSGQLSGLISGFDGAYTYRSLLDPFATLESSGALARQIILQNWGQFALIAVIVLGNLAALLGRDGGA